MKKLMTLAVAFLVVSAVPAFAHCGQCGLDGDKKGSMKGDWMEG